MTRTRPDQRTGHQRHRTRPAGDRTSTPRRPRRPLAITGDQELLEDLLRLAAAAGVELEVAADPFAARGHYATAPLVLLGEDQAPACRRARLPRRGDVILVTRNEGVLLPPVDDLGDGPYDPDADADPAGSDLFDHAGRLGAAHVATLPAGESWLVERIAGSVAHGVPAPVVAVLGGRGGAGASVLAAGLAVTAAAFGRRVLLVDADPLGGGLDLVLGWEDDGGLRWPELTGSSGRIDPGGLVGALPGRGDLALLSFDRGDLATAPPEAMAAVLAAGRAARDLVVVDAPRRLDPAAVVALQTADRGLLVVPAEVRAATAAARVAGEAKAHCADLRLVVRGPSPGRLGAEEISRSLGLPLAGTLRPELGLPATLEGGQPPTATGRGPLAALCRRIVTDLCRPAETVAA